MRSNDIRKTLPRIATLLILIPAVNATYCYYDYNLGRTICTGSSNAARIGIGVGISVAFFLLGVFIRVARSRRIQSQNLAHLNRANLPQPHTQMQTQYSAQPALGGINNGTGPTNAYLPSGGNNNYIYDPANAAQTPQYPPATYDNAGGSMNAYHALPTVAPSAEPYVQQLQQQAPPGYEYTPLPGPPSPPQKARE